MASITDELSALTDNNFGASLDATADEMEDEDFLLGMDGPSNRSAVYGRDFESIKLLSSYNRVVQTNQPQLAVVHGLSGSGKTSLVDTLREPVCSYGGYFCAGKFFLNSAQEPYSAIVAALSDLCDLVQQSDDYCEARRSEIQQALGTDGHLLARAISSISPFLDEIPVEGDDGGLVIKDDMTFLVFKVACKTFLRAMQSTTHPIVLFLDDIQWMDEGSRELLDSLLQDFDLRNVLLIFAYRDEEAYKVHKMLKAQKIIADIQLSNLDEKAVYQMVSSAANAHSDDVRELSNLISKRTAGHAFHVVQFLNAIQQEGLVKKSHTTGGWIFEVDNIQREIMISDTSADLLYRRIQRLDTELKEMLKVASLLGYHFSGPILVELASATVRTRRNGLSRSVPHQAIAWLLTLAVREEFIERTSGGFQFSHDKILSAFQSMISKDEADELHLLAGNVYEKNGDNFNAAVHLNAAEGLIIDHEQRVKLVRINSDTATYCRNKMAFTMAVTFLRTGLRLLDEDDKWSDELYELSFAMTESLARMELIVGNFDACKKATAETLRRGRSVESKIKSLLIDVEVRLADGGVDESIATANRALKALGIKMPRKVGFRHVLIKFMRVKRMVAQKSDNDVLSLPIMTNKPLAAAIRILLHVSLFCLLKDEKHQALYSALLGCQLTLTNGLSPDSASAFTLYALSEVLHGNHERAYRSGSLALQLQHRLGSESSWSTVGFVLISISHWKEPLHELGDPLYRVGNKGLDVGDVNHGTFFLSQSFFVDNLLGANLPELEKRTRSAYERVRDLGQDRMIVYLQPLLQYIIQLQSEVTDWIQVCTLSGEIMEEESYIEKCSHAKFQVLVGLALKLKTQLACHFGLFELSEALLEHLSSLGMETAMSFVTTGAYAWSFFACYLFLQRYRESGKRRHLSRARMYKKRLERMELAGSPNATPILAFLSAQEGSLKGTNTSMCLSKTYDKAIHLLAASQMVQFEGMANEQAGFAFARLGHYANAQRYFERALDIYKNEWGSLAKFNWLQEQSDKILAVLQYESTAPLVEVCAGKQKC